MGFRNTQSCCAAPRFGRGAEGHPTRRAGATTRPLFQASAPAPGRRWALRVVGLGVLGVLASIYLAAWVGAVVACSSPGPVVSGRRCSADWDRLCWPAAIRPTLADQIGRAHV